MTGLFTSSIGGEYQNMTNDMFIHDVNLIVESMKTEKMQKLEKSMPRNK
jgi:hypothetical protein